MTILDAKSEEQAVHNTINWKKREELAYPEEEQILQRLREYVPKPKRHFKESELENFRKYYKKVGSERKTCRKFNITLQELNEAIKL
jgi:hypothetical protein